ncbi:MAG: hypothetical protein LBG31_00545 [Prevotellaceae bacterium]|jgi:hypothetical protein|nr:hypothetical protein [Prevotellaceae bacterium]
MESTAKNPASKLPEQVIIPGIMEFLRANSERISLETYGKSYEEVTDYFERMRRDAQAVQPSGSSAKCSTADA